MATDILIKRSTTPGAVPTTGDLSTGELAINTADKRLFTNNSGTIVEIGTAPTSLAVTNNGTIGGTLDVTGNTTVATGTATNWTVTGTLTVATPSNSTDAASKGYVDTADALKVNKSGDTMSGNLAMGTNKITGLGTPTVSTDAATKGYVDAQVTAVIDSAPGALDTLNELAAAINDDANFATTVTNALAGKLALAGGTMTGDIAMGANKVTSTATPATDDTLTRKGYVDTQDATKLNLSGGTMTGNITMGANAVTSTATPATADTLTRKGYVDSILGSATDAATSAAAAASSATDAANSATAASTSATNAATSASNASTSETNAATSATASASSATSSANSATAAASSATAAAASAASAATAYDNFDDRYLGSKTSDPTLDNDGNALITGALYFNSTAGEMRIYDGSVWIPASTASVETMEKFNFTATSGQTVFTGSDDNAKTLALTVGAEIVTLNGVVLEETTDYTRTSDTITLTSGATTGDELNVFAFGNFTVADTVSASTGGTFTGAVTFDGGVSTSADITFGDNDKAIFGAGSDLQIYHDGTNSYISDSGQGRLIILSNGASTRINTSTGEIMAEFVKDAEVSLRHNNAVKFETTATGIDVTGTAVTDGLTVAGNVSVDGGTIKLDGNYPVGTNNVALGDQSLNSLTSGASNAAFGAFTLRDTTSGLRNTGLGYAALIQTTTANDNTGAGHYTLGNNTTGANNTAVGSYALSENTTGYNNTALGFQAGVATTTGFANVFIGNNAGDAVTTATGSMFAGTFAGHSVTTGVANTLVGGSYGGYAGGSLTTGRLNTFIGTDAGHLVTTGSANTILGAYDGNQGGLDIRTSSNNIVLSDGDGNPRLRIATDGDASFAGDVTEIYKKTAARLYSAGNTDSTTGTMPAEFSVGGTSTATRYLVGFGNVNGVVGTISVASSSTSYNTSSDYRLKENVVDLTGAVDRVKQLKPSQFNFITSPDITVDGFLAHEVQNIVPEAITGEKDAVDDEGNPVYQGIDQSKLVPLLTAALKEAITEIESLKARVQALETN